MHVLSGVGATTSSTCKSCEAGTYTGFDGASVCKMCFRGSFALTGSTSCILCEPGSFTAKNGSESCVDCSTGHYASYMGATVCSPCALKVNSSLNSTNITCVSINNNSLCTMMNKCLDPQCSQGILGRYTPGEDYNDNELMTITIVSPPATVISLIFTLFMTEPDYDGVQVFTCTDATCHNSTLLGFFSGKGIPPPQYSYTGVMQIVWSSDVCCPKPSSACPCDDPINANLLTGWLANFFVSGPMECSKCAAGSGNCEDTHTGSRRSLQQFEDLPGTFYSELPVSKRQKASPIKSFETRGALRTYTVGQRPDLYSGQDTFCGKARGSRMGTGSLDYNEGCALENSFAYLAMKGAIQSRRAYQSLQGNDLPLKMPANLRASLHVNELPGKYFLCDATNDASYGPCLASTYSALETFNLPTAERPCSPGLEFQISVRKEDSYGQTILTDSTSLLQVFAVSDNVNQSLSILGTTVVQMQQGQALFTISIQPSFASVSFAEGKAQLQSKPFIYFTGIDSQALLNLNMRSINVGVYVTDGTDVCPAGYVLSLENSNGVHARQGSCSLCKPGTYSVSPLKGAISDKDPSCLNCPLGGDCANGGDNVSFAVGKWIVSAGIYKLIECPAGYQLQNSLTNQQFSQDSQACLKCTVDEYILNSSSPEYTCMKCPIGAICNGQSLKGRVPGSVWKSDMATGIFKLLFCPAVLLCFFQKKFAACVKTHFFFRVSNLSTLRTEFILIKQHSSVCPVISNNIYWTRTTRP